MSHEEFIWRFTPSRTKPELLEQIFVQRQSLLADIVDRVAESANSKSMHHILLIGPRGIGKTHLISLLHYRITQRQEFSDKLRIAWFLEDETVTSFVQLLKRIYELLSEENPKEFPRDWLDNLLEETPSRIETALEAELIRQFRDRTLLLFIENLDYVFDGMGTKDLQKWRSFLQEHSFTCIVATSQRLFSGVQKRTETFFGFFSPTHLRPLSVNDAVDLLCNIAEQKEQPELDEFLHTPDGRSRVRALHHLAGGNHRIYIVLSGFITRDSLDELTQPFEKMADELTPYYQERMRWLSPQQRQIVEHLCNQEAPCTPGEIAKALLASDGTISSQLKKLLDFGYVVRSERGRESVYELAEPLMRLASEVKEKRRKPLKLLVDFLRIWYRPERLTSLMQGASSESLRNHLEAAIALSQQGPDPRIKAILDDIERAQTDGDDEELLTALEENAHTSAMAADWFRYAYMLGEKDRYEPAIDAYRKVVALDPKFQGAWNNLAADLHSTGKTKEALVCIENEISNYPNLVLPWANKGRWLSLKRKLRASRECFRNAANGVPTNARDMYWRGYALNELGLHAEAAKQLEETAAVTPGDASTWQLLADVLSCDQLKKYDLANECCDKLLALKKESYECWLSKGYCLGMLQRYDAAINCFERAIAIDATFSDAWNNKGYCLNKSGRYAEALQFLEKSIGLHAEYAWPYFNQVESLFALNEWERGFSALRTAFVKFPRSTENDADALVELIRVGAKTLEVAASRVQELISIYKQGGSISHLGKGLVKSLKILESHKLSETALIAWKTIWNTEGHMAAALKVPLRIFDVGVRYLVKKDKKVLLDLLAAERRILLQALMLENPDD